jgi:hypothetical protein
MTKIMREDISNTMIDTAPLDMNKAVKAREKLEKEEQKKVENYNNKEIYEYDKDLKSKKWIDSETLIRLFKLDYITKIESSVIGSMTTRKKRWIEADTPSGIKQVLVPDPLPYKMRGVVCRIAQNSTVEHPFKEGDVVEISGRFDIQGAMYYPDKDNIDQPMSKEDVMAGLHPFPLHKGYFKISPFLVESVIG